MRKIYLSTLLISLLSTQAVFANHGMSGDKACGTIADACLAAGFVKTESASKGMWDNCMKPIILGKSVSGVTVDKKLIKPCRKYKIKETKLKLKELKSAK